MVSAQQVLAENLARFETERDQVEAYFLKSSDVESRECPKDQECRSIVFDFHLQPQWHVYWKNPGDTGTAARVRTELSEWAGWQPGKLLFPTPKLLQSSGLASYGYEDRAVLVLPLRASALGSPRPLRVQLDWLICQSECIPESFVFQVGPDIGVCPSEVLRTWALTQPMPQTLRGHFSIEKSQLRLQVHELKFANLSGLYFFPEENPLLKASAKQTWSQQGTDLGARLEMDSSYQDQNSTILHGLIGREEGDLQAHEVEFVREESESLWHWLILAFVGGLILNLMPCVFPVLSLKILSFAKYAKDPRGARNHGIVFSVGVLVSFWVLAMMLLLLKQAGAHLGWGFQLQDPRFLSALIILFFLMSLNFLGLFEFDLPISGLNGLLNKSGYAGSFFSGVLATVVATPCTAPFMGAAVGVALAQPSVQTFLIFTSLGLGMAAPYLVLSSTPQLLSLLPKPGVWMENLKQFLAFPLLLTVVWLLSVFSQMVTPMQFIFVQGGLVSVTFGLWLGRFSKKIAVLWVIFTVLILAYGVSKVQRAETATASHGQFQKEDTSEPPSWHKFSVAALAEALSKKQNVFIDFTASWCLSCQLNKKAVLETEFGQKLFKDFKVVLFKADWTEPNDEIENFLQKYQRSGIPFYPLFAAGAEPPVILPEVLTPGILQEALQKNLKQGE